MKLLTASLCGLAIAAVSIRDRSTPSRPLVVHEWGTITTRHAPDGTPQGRLNRISESESLPSFVYRYEPPATRVDPKKAMLKEPIGPGRPDVTMRLETPVIYFHPAAGSGAVPPFDVRVAFRGGVVNEFYPNAAASIALDTARIGAQMRAGLVREWDGAVLNNLVVGRLAWGGITLSENAKVQATTNHVWLAPRAARSTPVRTRSGEGERYLFYRGVAHLDALVQTELSRTGVQLRAPERLEWLPSASMTIPRLWFVGIRPDGKVAFREQGPVVIDRDAPSADLARFAALSDADYSATGLAGLRASMKGALVRAGLFDDEAGAMLETWKHSYFGNPGLRVFYVVPNEWTNYYLPLEISVPHTLTRVLVGRIDLLER